MNGRLIGRRASLDMRRNVFEHYDGVVYHHSDGDGERRKRDDVDRVTDKDAKAAATASAKAVLLHCGGTGKAAST